MRSSTPTAVRHFVVRHRRSLAAGCAFLSVLLAISALQPASPLADSGGSGSATSVGLDAGAALPVGQVAAPVRLADGDVTEFLQAGSVVDVLAADGKGEAVVVASGVRVLQIPHPDSRFGSTDFGGALVLLSVSSTQAIQLAGLTAVGPLSVVLTPE